MTDILLTAEAWLGSVHKTHASQDVTYQRGSATVSVKATLAPSQQAVDANGQVLIGYVAKDFLIHAADLMIGGRTFFPEVGDTIIHGTSSYRVVAPNAGEKPWRESGAGGVVLRITTKQVK